MLQTIREKSKGPVLTILIGSICLIFAATGIDSMLGSNTSSGVAKVNGEKITNQELNEAIFLEKQKLFSQMGKNVDPEKLKDENLKKQAIETLVKQKLLLQVADSHGMSIAESEINKVIIENPEFQENGKFSNDRFKLVLGYSGLSSELFKRLYSNDMLVNQIRSGVVNSEFTTPKDISINTRFTHQKRDIRFVILDLEKEKTRVTVSDDQIKNYYNANSDKFRSDESAIVEYIELNRTDFNPEISDAQIQDVYNEEKIAFKSEDKRDVSHILIELDKKSDKDSATKSLIEIKNKLAAGESFADLARKYSEDLGSRESGGVLGELNVGTSPKPFVAAALTLPEGGVSDVVETDAGLHLIQVTKITTPIMPTFEERKAAIVADLQKTKSTPLYLEAVEKLKDVTFNASDLSDPAETLNAKIKMSGLITRKGGEGIFATPSLYKAVFNGELLKGEQNSDVIDINSERSVVLHVKEYKPSEVLPFEIVSEKVRGLLITETSETQIEKMATSIKNDLVNGKDLDEVALKNGITVNIELGVKRSDSKTNAEIVALAFKLPKTNLQTESIETLKLGKGDYAVLAVSNIKDGLVADVDPMELESYERFLSSNQANEQFKSIETAIKSKAVIDIYK